MSPVNYKRVAIILAVVACATLVWAASKPWLESPVRFSHWTVALWPALAVTLLAAVTGLAWALLTHPADRLAAILASWAAFIIFWRPDIWYASALPLFLVFWWEAGRRIRNDLADRHTVRINRSIGQGVKFILLGAFLMVSLGFYLLPSSRAANVRTVSQGLQRSLESAYEHPLVEDQLAELPPALQSQVRRDAAEFVDTTVRDALGPVAKFIPPILAFALFLGLWSVSFILREAAMLMGIGIFWMLKRTGFVQVVQESVKAEVLRL